MNSQLRVRRGGPRDLPAVTVVQEASPEAAQWKVSDYLEYEFRIAEAGGRIAGFLVARTLAAGEREVLNLAVAPEFRRGGVARKLLQSFLAESPGAVYLEVRESNGAGRGFYKSMGFQEVSTRSRYYETPDGPPETAIVMKFHSC
jgi:ribosomal protein S18 acetylase RimI-like enzyme